MSCYFKALPQLIPQLLLMAAPGREIMLVSPWIGDVTLVPPVFRHGPHMYTGASIRLGELLLRLAQDFNMQVTLVLRELDYRFAPVVDNWPTMDRLTLRMVPNLHAKAVVTDSFVLLGSANLLQTSLSRNVEVCELKKNPYRTPRRWLSSELGLQI